MGNELWCASMGPRSGDRGNRRRQSASMASGSLQWGRDLVIAEIDWIEGIIEAYWGASMGPRSGDRGNTRFARVNWARKEKLQWGRDLVIVEMKNMLLKSAPHHLLQWGRDLVIAEICVRFQMLVKFALCFNGAAIW